MLNRLLLDQSSGVASLGQQAIVMTVTELTQLSSENPLYSKVIHNEIFDGVIEGLLLIIDGKNKSPRAQDDQAQQHRISIDEGIHHDRRRSSATPGFETSVHVHHSDNDLDQGELSLAKIACISVKCLCKRNYFSDLCM
jgi:hypothetical protein